MPTINNQNRPAQLDLQRTCGRCRHFLSTKLECMAPTSMAYERCAPEEVHEYSYAVNCNLFNPKS